MNKWIAGARPRTLPAAITPVLVGTALRHTDHLKINLVNAFLALLVSLSLQIAVNYANDYSDGIRGTDDVRVGPVRLVGSGLATPAAVKRAALATFTFAGLVGLYLSSRTSWWLTIVGALSIGAAWTYTGGKKPYGYLGLGEFSVFIFFGLVATVGSYAAQSLRISWQSILLSIPVGVLSCAILAINNLRDLPKDALVEKRTLAVRLGEIAARIFFVSLLVTAHLTCLLAAFISPWCLATLALAPISLKISREILKGTSGVALIPVLGQVGKLQLLFGATLALALLA